ncbi:MAG: hypothetical protein ACRC10_11445 [Thermoguttaceae bacterium]
MNKHYPGFQRKQRTEQGAKMSLFPFLAVLICTMGVLILLLVVIARNMRLQGLEEGVGVIVAMIPVEHESVDETVEPIPVDWKMIPGLSETATSDEVLEKLQDEILTVDWLTREIVTSQEKTVEQLNDVRARVGVIEDSINKLAKEIESRTAMIQSLIEGKSDPGVELEQLRKILAEKESERERIESDLRQLQEQQEQTARSYAIVPYKGPSGTFRRPIYIECRSDSVVLQPEGIVLRAQDFTTPDFRDNPLEMLVRTARQYLVETQQLARDTEPYPLFLVRPSGVSAYEAARKSLGSWRDDFGYELLEEDWNLEFPVLSEELQRRLNEQVQIARSRQAIYRESLIAKGGPSQQFRVSSRGGVEPIRQFGRNRGSGNLEDGNETGLETGTGSGPNVNSGSGLGDANATLQSNPQYGSPSRSLLDSPRMETSGFAGPIEPGSVAVGTSSKNSGLTELGTNGTNFGHDPFGTVQGELSNGEISQNGQMIQATPTGQYSQNSQFETFRPFGMSESVGSAESTAELAGTTAGQNGLNGANASSETTGSNGPSVSKGQNGPKGATGTSTSGPTTSQSVQSGQSVDGTNQGMPSFDKVIGRDQQKNRPKNWALKGAEKTAQPVRRIVKIQCCKDQLILLRQPGLSQNKVIPIEGSMDLASSQLVELIWKYMETWNIAGENQYWVPYLKVQVQSDAGLEFEQLQAALKESGMIVNQE